MGIFNRALNFGQPAVRGPGDYVEEKYNQMLKGAAGGLWHKFMNMAGGGFAKGVIVTTLVVIGGAALAGGLMGATVAGLVMPTFEAGMAAGVSNAIGFLAGSFAGWSVLLAGGVGGAIMEKTRVETGRMTAEEARRRGREYEQLRQMQQDQQLQPAVSPAAAAGEQDTPAKNFRAAEEAREAQRMQKRQESPSYGRSC